MFKTAVGISIITGHEVTFVDATSTGIFDQLHADLEAKRTAERRTLHRMIYPTKRQTQITF